MASGAPTRSTRAYTSPWPSLESLNASSRPVLTKRHSAYALSNLPVPQPTVPIRPPRHPARVNSFTSTHSKGKPRSRRPSSVDPSEEPRESLDDTRSIKSSLTKPMYTGPVEEVTPWELHPVPTSPSSISLKASSSPLQNRRSFSSSSTPHISLSPAPHKSTLVSTGPVEEVTPWELLPGPSQTDDKPPSPVSLKQSPTTHLFSPLSRTFSNPEPVSVPVYPRATATGPTEDVTPWELTPAPAEGQELEVGLSRAMSSSLTMAQLEEVTPWELYPAPTASGSTLSSQTQVPIGASRLSSSNSTKSTVAEVGHRVRRSTGSKPSKAARSSIPAIGILNIPQVPVESTAQQKGISSNAPQFGGFTPPGSASGDLKFSTADRAILQQLKMSIRAREAQFMVKGVGNSVVGGEKSSGKKHHCYSVQEAPYPRSYEREVIDLDVWETMFCLDICKSLTWHVFETPPTKVLELGCGTGTWILHAAQNWKECHFVGLDIVPLHPDLQNVGSPDLASRITWIQHNFLDGLPFQNEEFDFVHIKRIALGVPENKWDGFFEEIARVMKPGAALEMVEEDLFFPGRYFDDNEDGSIRTSDSLSPVIDWNPTSSGQRNGFLTCDDAFEEVSPKTPTTSSTMLPRTPSRSNSPAHSPRSAKKENGKEVMVNEEQISYDTFPSPSIPTLSFPITAIPITPPPTNATFMPFPTMSKEPTSTPLHRSTSRPLLSVQTEASNSESGVMSTNAGFGSSSLSLFSALGNVNEALMNRARSSSVQTSNTAESKPGASSLSLADSELKSKTKPSSVLFQMQINPRDHTLLEAIWYEMLSSRWVNVYPLSVLNTYLEWHFKDVRTHPPLMYTFPPTPASDDSDSDSDPNVASIRAKQPSIKLSNPGSEDKGKLGEEHLSLSQKSRQQSFPYVTLDGTRGHAYSPSQQANVISSKAREGSILAAKRMSRLPTTTLNIDMRTLNLHLTLRAKEIVACSESMWEWVVQFQQASKISIQPLNAPGDWSSDMTRSAILEMTRDDFNLLLNNFTLDFQDQAAVGHVLQERFDWRVFRTPPVQDRKLFDLACEKYQNWVLMERARLSLDHKAKGITTDTRNSTSTPNINPSPRYSSTVITRSHSSPYAYFPAEDDETPQAYVSSPPSDPAIPPPPLSPSPSCLTTELRPTQKLSRSMRVFIACKATS